MTYTMPIGEKVSDKMKLNLAEAKEKRDLLLAWKKAHPSQALSERAQATLAQLNQDIEVYQNHLNIMTPSQTSRDTPAPAVQNTQLKPKREFTISIGRIGGRIWNAAASCFLRLHQIHADCSLSYGRFNTRFKERTGFKLPGPMTFDGSGPSTWRENPDA